MLRIGGAVAAMCALGALLGASPASAAPCYSSTPNSVPFTDSYGDGDLGVAPEIVGGMIATDGGCTFAVAYSIADQAAMLDSDFLSWFIDIDNNPGTGSSSGFEGADFAIGRLGSGFVGVSRYDAATGGFESVGQGQALGPFGAQVNLSGFNANPQTTLTVAGGSSWTSSSGERYNDWAPDIGLAPFAFGLRFSATGPTQVPVAPTAPPVVPASPNVPRAPDNSGLVRHGPPTLSTPAKRCKVPTLRGLRLSSAKRRLRSAHCSLGKVRRVSSKRYAGRVISSKPGRGRRLAARAKVSIVVGKSRARRSMLQSEPELFTEAIDAAIRSR